MTLDPIKFRELVEEAIAAFKFGEEPDRDHTEKRLSDFLLSHASELLAVVEAQSRQQPWSQDISGAIWAEIRSGLTGRFEEQFMLHQQADRYERSSAHLDECARILTRRIEDKLWPTPPEPAQ